MKDKKVAALQAALPWLRHFSVLQDGSDAIPEDAHNLWDVTKDVAAALENTGEEFATPMDRESRVFFNTSLGFVEPYCDYSGCGQRAEVFALMWHRDGTVKPRTQCRKHMSYTQELYGPPLVYGYLPLLKRGEESK